MRGKKIAIAARQLVDLERRQIVSSERWLYAVELTKLLVDLGHEVEWWQFGSGWRTEIIRGVPLWGTLPAEGQMHTYPRASEAFLEQSAAADGAIYFDPILAYPQVHPLSIAIDHGVYWDDAMFESSLPNAAVRDEWKRRLWCAYTAVRAVVAVDTGVIQWATASWPGMQHRFTYIPNFVPTLGEPTANEAPAGGSPTSEQPESARPAGERPNEADAVGPPDTRPFRVLYPCDLVPSEGVSEVVRAVDDLLESGDAYQFYLTGNGPEEACRFIAEWAKQRHPHVCYKPQRLSASLLAQVDVVVLPAKSGQGTSMRCLQAMAAGKPVVVAQTGGLTDVVIHDHSGVVIQPTAERLVRVLKELRQQPERRRLLGHYARQVAASFSLEHWRARWRRFLEHVGLGS